MSSSTESLPKVYNIELTEKEAALVNLSMHLGLAVMMGEAVGLVMMRPTRITADSMTSEEKATLMQKFSHLPLTLDP